MKRALVKRWNALGDVILTTPIVKRLHQKGYAVDVCTLMLDVFYHSPYARAYSGLMKAYPKYDKVVELNHAYELNPKIHIIDAYSLVAFGDTKTEHKCELFFKDPSLNLPILPKGEFIAVHMGIGWANRTFSEEFWTELALNLHLPLVFVGGRGDRHPKEDWEEFDLVNLLSIHGLAHAIAKAKLFIGPDSGPLHIAQTTNTPCIGLYTCAKAEYRMHGNMHPIIPDIDCYGCLHDEPPPVCYVGCRRKDFKCLDLITPDMVLRKVEELLNE